jgi:hypothetical protein
MTATANRQELLQHADRLHQALYALATSEDRYLSSDNDSDEPTRQGPYDHVQEALIQVLRRIVGTRHRAERVRLLMLDDSGEGVAYWVEQEAQEHQYEMDMAHEEALELAMDEVHAYALKINPRGIVIEIAAGPDGIRTRAIEKGGS